MADVIGTWNHEEAARYIGCTAGTLRVWCSKRRVPFIKLGRKVRFRKADLDRFLDKNMVKPN